MESLLTEHDVVASVKYENYLTDDSTDTSGSKMDKPERKRKDNVAKNIIVQCIHDNQLNLLRNKNSAYEMWNALIDTFQKKGLSGKLVLKRKLFSIKMQETESLDSYITRFEGLISELKSIDSKSMEEEDTICILMMGLSKKYETVVSIIENMSQSDISYEVVKRKLKNVDEKSSGIQPQSSKVDSQMSFHASSKSAVVCHYCKKSGHIKKNCFAFKNNYSDKHNNYRQQARHQYGQSSSNSQVAEVDEDHGPDRRVNFMCVDESNESVSLHNSLVHKGEEELEANHCDDKFLVFYVDSGCTDHVVKDADIFSSYVKLKDPLKISIAKDGDSMEAIGIGNVTTKMMNGNEVTECELKNVLHVPLARKNLLSVKRIEMSGFHIIFAGGLVQIMNSNKKVIASGLRQNLYELKFIVNKLDTLLCNYTCNISPDKLWHLRYGHLNFPALKELIDNKMVDGIDNFKVDTKQVCEPCINGKMTRLPFSHVRNRADDVLKIIHSDICGPIDPVSHHGYRYVLTLLDDYSHFLHVYLLKAKSEFFVKFKEFFFYTRSLFNKSVSKIRCDNGGEYRSKEFQNFCKDNGIFIDYTVPYTPELNGKAERMNRSVIERARTMLYESKVPKKFWSEAVYTATYLLNRSPTSTLNNHVTPAELWFGKKQNVGNLKVFGCSIYYHIPKHLRSKLDAKAKKGVFLGYAPNGYRVLDINKNDIIIVRDVKFMEDVFFFSNESCNLRISNPIVTEPEEDQCVKTTEDVTSEVEQLSEEECQQIPFSNEVKEKRTSKLPSKYNDFEMYMALCNMNFVEDVPTIFQDVLNNKSKDDWLNAMDREISSIEENQTWEIVDKPVNKQILDTKWVYAFKDNETGTDKFKARLVVRGFKQDERSFNYEDIYAPVAKMTTIRTLLSVGVENDFHFHQLDIKTAFLNGKLDDEVYLNAPPGIPLGNNKVLKLKKALYGLKQASSCWNKTIHDFLEKSGFKRSENDYCLYSKTEDNVNVFLLIYVDDLIVGSSSLDLVKKVKSELSSKFKLKDKQELKYFLGLEIDHNREEGTLKVKQSNYTMKLLKRFNMEKCSISNVPIDPSIVNLNHVNNEQCTKFVDKPYRELIGSLMYLMLGSRPDLCFSINYFSRYQTCYSEQLWNYLKQVLKYLKGTIDYGLIYRKSNKIVNLVGYVDSDWGGDTKDRKSVSGYLLKINNNIVHWSTKKQACVALSTTESELIALCACASEGLWLKKIILDLNCNIQSFVVNEDNQGCLHIIINPERNARVKHIDIKYKYICEKVKSKEIIVKYISTENQIADVLTKALLKCKFVKFRDLLVSEF